MMWKPSVNAIWLRAAPSVDARITIAGSSSTAADSTRVHRLDGGFGAQGHAAAGAGVPATSRRARRAPAGGPGVTAAGGVGRPAGQHAASRAALAARAGRRRRPVGVGASLARPGLGPSVPDLRRREARLRAVLAREAARQR